MAGKLSRRGNTLALTGGLGGGSAAAAAQFLALLTAAPADHSFDPATEYTATGYARQAVTWNAPTAADPPVVTNNGAVTFGPFTAATGDTVSHVALVDAVSSAAGGNPDTADNMLAYWALDAPETPDVNDSIEISDQLLSIGAN